MDDNNTSSGDPKENAVQENEAGQITKDESSLGNMVRRLQDSMSIGKIHKFWETQPVGQFKDVGDSSLAEGPIEPPTPLSEVKQEPYNLPSAYEWTTCDMDSEETCLEVYNLLKNNYVEDDENLFRFNYSKEFLGWALRPPGYFASWHIGVRAKASKKLVAFISGVPARIRILTKPTFEHWLLPKESVVDSFLVESQYTREVTDFCSFYTLPSSILGNQTYSTLKAAYSYYNVSTKTPLLQLMNDALIVAKKKDFDVFNALDVMENESFSEGTKIRSG
ncbi:Glycylpeptide N-tetradecanoyltransferase 1, partial [Cucurbita argyrosperma subsp. sororia]